MISAQSKYKITYSEFQRLLNFVINLIDKQGLTETLAQDLIISLRDDMKVYSSMKNLLFAQTEEIKGSNHLVDIKVFNSIKNVIWSCVLDDEKPKEI